MLRRTMMAAGSAASWTPAELSPFAWLDDTTPTSSPDYPGMGFWGNRGVGAASFRSNSPPAVTPSGLSGKRVMTFSGGQRLYADETGDFAAGRGAVWYAAVYRRTGGSGNSCVIGCSIGGGFSSHRASLFAGRSTSGNSARPSVGGRRLDSDSFNESQHPVNVDGWAIVSGVIDYQGRTVSLSVDGGARQVVTGAFTASGDSQATTGRGITIGAVYLGNLVDHLVGGIAEVLADNSGPLSLTNEQKLVGYLAHKWGLAANLPPGHPYKAAPPA